MFLQLLMHSEIRGGGCNLCCCCFASMLAEGVKNSSTLGHPSPMWITASAVWSWQQQQQFPDHGTVCGSGVGALMITKEATAPLVAQFCNVALRIAPESSTLNLCLCPPNSSIAVC